MPQPTPDLTADARAALAKAALLEDPFPIQALLASGSAPEALDPLFDLELLEESDAGEACFTSESVREEALRSLAWSQKRKLSQTLAETCEALLMPPALVARLYLQAQSLPAARTHFIKAGEDACRRNHHREGLKLMQAALEIWPIGEDLERRKQTLKEMARCANACSDHASASLALSELLAIADDDNPVERIELQRQLAQNANARGDFLKARELLQQAASLAEESGLVAQSAALWRSLAQAQGDALRLREALESLEASRRAATKCRNWALLSDGLAFSAMVSAMLGRIKDANALLEEALALAIKHDLPDQITTAYRRQANVNEYAANYIAYRDKELSALDRCRNLGDANGTVACLACVSYAFYRLGQYDNSLTAISEALEDRELPGQLLAGAISVNACIHAARGSGSDVLENLENAHRLNRLNGAFIFEFYVLAAKGFHAVLQGKGDIARQTFEELIAFWRETDDRQDVCSGLLFAASFFAQENDAQCLSNCVDILNTIQSDSESKEPRAAFFAACAESAWQRGEAEAAMRDLQKACLTYRELNLPLEEAWILWRLGYVQSQTERGAEAAISWRQAEAIIQKLSLRPLGRALNRDRSQQLGNDKAASLLTARQLEIARLIASGRTNKEAAADLAISPRTVEMHVAALLERLGCRSRAEATKKVAELGLLR